VHRAVIETAGQFGPPPIVARPAHGEHRVNALFVHRLDQTVDVLDRILQIDRQIDDPRARRMAARAAQGDVTAAIGDQAGNVYAVDAGELYVQGDLEVDGSIYGSLVSFHPADLNGMEQFKDLKDKIASSEGTKRLLEFFGKEVAIVIYPVEFSDLKPESIKKVSSNVFFVTRLSGQAKFSEFLSKYFLIDLEVMNALLVIKLFLMRMIK